MRFLAGLLGATTCAALAQVPVVPPPQPGDRELRVGSGPLGGIGLELEVADGYPRIVSAIDGTPAERSDLRNNTGGLLYSCVAMAAVFLPETALVTELRGRTK